MTLTERITRKEIIRRIPKKECKIHTSRFKPAETGTAKNFPKYLRALQRIMGQVCTARIKWGKRAGVEIYYAHPYSSWEKRSNENANHLIRRFFPKGMEAKRLTKKRIEEIENWINTLYRKILGWRTAEEVYKEELEKLSLQSIPFT